MIDRAVRWGFNLAIIGLFSVCGLLYAQQNQIIAGQEKRFEKYCAQNDQKLENKVDNKTLQMMIRRLDSSKEDRLRIKQQQQKDREDWQEERKEQRKVNQKLIETLHSLELHMKEFE